MRKPGPKEARLYDLAAQEVFRYLEDKPCPFARGFWMVIPDQAGVLVELIAMDRDRFDWNPKTAGSRAGMDQIRAAVDSYNPDRQIVVVISDPHPGGLGVSCAKLRRPGQPKPEPKFCDFCNSTSVAWRYPFNRFELIQVTEPGGFLGRFRKRRETVVYEGDWLACGPCSRFWDADDIEGLAARHKRRSVLPPGSRETAESVAAALGTLWAAFKREQSGPRVRL